MNTSILTLALATALAAPTWQTSYHQAQQTAVQQKKPMVVFFSPGSNGWSKVTGAAGPNGDVAKLLADKYVCVQVDTASTDGKKLAENFAISEGRGVVISDRSGSLQAFWHQGDLSSQSLTQYLQKYAEPGVAVNGTETVNSGRTSYYQGSGYSSPAPAMRAANC